jgi:hypothetical protein
MAEVFSDGKSLWWQRLGRKDRDIQRRLEVFRPEDLTRTFVACMLTRTLCWLHALPAILTSLSAGSRATCLVVCSNALSSPYVPSNLHPTTYARQAPALSPFVTCALTRNLCWLNV